MKRRADTLEPNSITHGLDSVWVAAVYGSGTQCMSRDYVMGQALVIYRRIVSINAVYEKMRSTRISQTFVIFLPEAVNAL
jgi:hypothetical protein